LKNPTDLDVISNHYRDSFSLLSPVPEESWKRALRWAAFADEFQLSDRLPAYLAAFRLLPEILWIGHTIPVRHDAIRRLGVAQATSTAVQTCINISNLHSAVEIMEQGLATIFQQMLQLTTDVDGLEPDQITKFRNLSSQLYTGTFSDSFSLVNDRNKLLEEIRKEPGNKYFLRPKPYKVLCHAAQGGPVITLNSHRNHCDAIIIVNSTSDPVHVPLPNVTLDALKSCREDLKQLLTRCNVRTRENSSSRLFGKREQFSYKPAQQCFADILDWLWVHVVAPIYESLALVSGKLLPYSAFTNIHCSYSMRFIAVDSGGYQLVNLQDSLYMQALQEIPSSIHTQQHWDLCWMHMPKQLPALHRGLLLLE
jgi:hypothetical protein